MALEKQMPPVMEPRLHHASLMHDSCRLFFFSAHYYITLRLQNQDMAPGFRHGFCEIYVTAAILLFHFASAVIL